MTIAVVMVLSLSLLVGCGGSGGTPANETDNAKASADTQAPETLEGTTWEVKTVTSQVTGKEKTDVPGGTLTFQNGQCSRTFADGGTTDVFPYE